MSQLRSTFTTIKMIVLLIFLVCAPALANVGVPGPIMFFGASMSMSPLQWIAVTMTMCTITEAAVFHYSKQYRRPFLASLYANVISMFAGIPLIFVGAFDPTWFVLPTLLSMGIEMVLISYSHKWFEAGPGTIKASPIFWGNLLSNVIMFGLLVYALSK